MRVPAAGCSEHETQLSQVMVSAVQHFYISLIVHILLVFKNLALLPTTYIWEAIVRCCAVETRVQTTEPLTVMLSVLDHT